MNSNETVKLLAVPIQNKIYWNTFLNGFRGCLFSYQETWTVPKCHSIEQTEIYIHRFVFYTVLLNIGRAQKNIAFPYKHTTSKIKKPQKHKQTNQLETS